MNEPEYLLHGRTDTDHFSKVMVDSDVMVAPDVIVAPDVMVAPDIMVDGVVMSDRYVFLFIARNFGALLR